jgi:hypothetical protein
MKLLMKDQGFKMMSRTYRSDEHNSHSNRAAKIAFVQKTQRSARSSNEVDLLEAFDEDYMPSQGERHLWTSNACSGWSQAHRGHD